jgi:CBS domain containing-hemolysin-like protein
MTDDDPSRLAKAYHHAENTNFFHKILHYLHCCKNYLSRNDDSASLKESFAEILEEHESEGAPIATESKEMIHNVLSFIDMQVSDVMVPRNDIVAIEKTTPFDEFKKAIITSGHTRIPIYKENLDNVIGFVHIKDLLPVFSGDKPFDINAIMREILLIPPSMKVLDLLAKMRRSRVHMAIVLDEYGGVDGLVTTHDLVEEIVGELQDEHDDSHDNELIKIDETTWEVSARIEIEELQKALDLKIVPEDNEHDFDTLAGLILSMVGHIPVKGEIIKHPIGLEFEVIDVDPRRVKKLLMRRVEPDPDYEGIEG